MTKNTPRLFAGAASVGAALALTSAAAFAQTGSEPATTTGGSTTSSSMQSGSTSSSGAVSTMTSPDGKSMTMTTTSGQNVVMLTPNASDVDKYRMRWAFYNADRRSVNRIKAMGFTETQTKEILNLAVRAGVETDYVIRRIQISGYPIRTLAVMHGVNPTALDDDLPGFNADGMAMLGDNSSAAMAGTTASSSTTASSAMAARGDIVDVAMGDPQLSTFVAAVRAAGLADTFKGAGPYTVFAPTNAAFAKLPAGTLDDLLKPENRDRLVSILQYHVVSGRVMASDIMGMSNPSSPSTLGGGSLNVKTTSPVMINDASVVRTDVAATNGVIHLIDTVLMPAATTGTAPSTTAPASPSTPSEPTTPTSPTTPPSGEGAPSTPPSTNP